MKKAKVELQKIHESEITLEEVLFGLAKTPKRLPCRLLYDERGSDLFDAICKTEDYYPTRTEMAMLEQYGPEIADLVGDSSLVLEFGAGNLRKAEILLRHFPPPVTYVPVDISKEHLFKNTARFSQNLPNVQVHAVCADFKQTDALRKSWRLSSEGSFSSLVLL